MQKGTNARVGQYASIAVAVETAIFAVSLVLGLAVRSNLGPLMGYAICILLAPSVVVLMASLYVQTTGEQKIFGLLALVAAVLYAPFCMGNYFLQLSVVASNPLNHPPEVLSLITFIPGSATFALDMFGYTFLCLSTLAAAFTLSISRDRALKIFCVIHGVIAIPTFAAPIMSGLFRSTSGQSNDIGSWVLLFWCALFIPIAILFRRVFQQDAREYAS